MKELLRAVIISLVVCTSGLAADSQASDVLDWKNLATLPDTLGFGGPFAGVHNKALIVAGGANFPDSPPWKDGKKVWYDGIYVLESKESKEWLTGFKLPRPLAYGAAISTDEGLILIGGSDAAKTYADVTMLQWDPEGKKITVKAMTPLPQPRAFLVAGKIGKVIYAGLGKRTKEAETCVKNFWSLDLSKPEGERKWIPAPDLPGLARLKAAAAVQSAGDDPKFLYVFGGSYVEKDDAGELKRTFLKEVWRFDPRGADGKGQWDRMSDMSDILGASQAIDRGQSHILIFSGSTGRHIPKPIQDRPLFGRNVLAYHTITNKWAPKPIGQMPQGVVTTEAVRWGKHIVIPSGETRPGVRTPNIQMCTPKMPEPQFGLINYGVLVTYLALLVGMGFYFSRREKTTDDFFLAGKRIPWWAAGLSIYATQLSAITFLSSPSVSYSKDWLLYPGKITLFLMAPVVICFYLPFFKRLKITTAYEYLEKRFSTSVRLLGSASFIIFQVARMAIVVYLPALALATVTGINVYTCLIIMATLAIVYTVMGGMEAVVWTDVVQTIILLAGLIVSLVVVLVLVGGPVAAYRTALADGKLTMFNWTWDTTTLTTWSIFIGTFALQFGPYTTDQAVIQRYLSTKDEKAAAKSIWTNGILSIPFAFLFLALGTCLYVYFKSRPDLVAVGMKNDAVFPLFIVQQLPMGVAGLVIAGVFAAAMSTLDSSMHSIATAVTIDWYRPFKHNATDRQCLNIARWVVVAVGLAAVGIASFMASVDIKSAFFLFQKILGLLSSSLVGIFILGVFTKRANTIGVLVGAATCLGLLLYIVFFTPINFYLYAIIGIGTCVTVGYVVSLMTPQYTRDVTGLNIQTVKRNEP